MGVVASEQQNPGVAWQRFLEGGPLAFLPLADGTSSVVWSVAEKQADRLLGLDDSSFLAELEMAAAGSPDHWPGRLKSSLGW